MSTAEITDNAADADGVLEAIQWRGDRLVLLDQRFLPAEEVYFEARDVDDVITAIREMVVRGAPAIGITAAYGVVLAARAAGRDRQQVGVDIDRIARARPTAVNLFWGLERLRKVLESSAEDAADRLLEEARRIHREDCENNRRMGAFGASQLGPDTSVLTHCNAGALATGGYGTALGVIRSAWHAGKITGLFVDETRPWLQGTRLTAWELSKSGIPATVVADSAAASLMARGAVQWVIVGADRICANGDTANKIGTYSLAVLARHHDIPLMVAAPTSTIDRELSSGSDIPIETRPGKEIWQATGARPPENIETFNPAFDVTPAELIRCIVTEKGVCHAPYRDSLGKLFDSA